MKRFLEKATDRDFIVEGEDQMGSKKKSRRSGSLRNGTKLKIRDEVMIKTEFKKNVEDMSFKELRDNGKNRDGSIFSRGRGLRERKF